MKRDLWKGARVLVTGYEGFLGSWLTRFLLERGAKVIGLDIRVRRKETILTKDELGQVAIYKGSVEDAGLIERILRTRRIGFVFHLAAWAIVGECLRKPALALSVNVRGTWNVLEAARKNKKIKGLVIASSDKAYGSHADLPYKEDCSLKGDHPYDVSKSCADLIAAAYHHTYGVPVCITRCGNIYGPGDFNFSRIIPDALRCAVTGKRLYIRSDGKFVRDYVYVKDIAAAYILLAERMMQRHVSGQAFNFSDENPMTVLALVKKIYCLAGVRPNYTIQNKVRYEIKEQFLSSCKARRLLNWKPRYGFDQALEETVAWYRKHFGRTR